jgi:di/tricarboxylate transporter
MTFQLSSDVLNQVPGFKQLELIDRSRLVSMSQLDSCTSGELLLTPSSEKSNHAILLIEGSVSVEQGMETLTYETFQWVGIEAAWNPDAKVPVVKANTSVQCLRVPLWYCKILLEKNPGLYSDWIRNPPQKPTALPPPLCLSTGLVDDPSVMRSTIAWILAILVSVFAFHALPHTVSIHSRIFFSALASAMTLWAFHVTDELVPGMIVLIVGTTIGLVSEQTLLSGFSAPMFWLCLGLTGVPIILQQSGILYRLAMLLVKHSAVRQTWMLASTWSLGLLLACVIPFVEHRVRILAQFLIDWMHGTKIDPRTPVATKVVVSTYTAATVFTHLLEMGSIYNLFAFAILPKSFQYEILAIGWTTLALAPLVILLTTNMLAINIFFHTRRSDTDKSPQQLDQCKTAIDVLGPIQPKEWHGVIAIVLTFLGFALIINQHISSGWLGLFLMISFSILRILNMSQWYRQIHWSSILCIGVMLSITHLVTEQKVDIMIQSWLRDISGDEWTAITVITLLLVGTVLFRLVLHKMPAFFLMTAFVVPLFNITNVDPWVGCFTILTGCDITFFSYQSSMHSRFLEIMHRANILIDAQKFQRFQWVLIFSKILSLYLSIPFWKHLCLI